MFILFDPKQESNAITFRLYNWIQNIQIFSRIKHLFFFHVAKIWLRVGLVPRRSLVQILLGECNACLYGSESHFLRNFHCLDSTDRMNGNGRAAVGLGKLPVKLIKIACVFVTQLSSISEVYRLHIRSST